MTAATTPNNFMTPEVIMFAAIKTLFNSITSILTEATPLIVAIITNSLSLILDGIKAVRKEFKPDEK